MSGNIILFDVDGTIITEESYIPLLTVAVIRGTQRTCAFVPLRHRDFP